MLARFKIVNVARIRIARLEVKIGFRGKCRGEKAVETPLKTSGKIPLQVRLSEASLGSHNSQRLSKPIWYGVWKSH